MGRAKSPSEWSPAYRKRMERVFANNPFATKTEARRGANSKEALKERLPEFNGHNQQDRTKQAIKNKLSNLKFREELGQISSKEAKDVAAKIKDLQKDIDYQYEKLVPGTNAYRKANEKIHAKWHELADMGYMDEDDPSEVWYH